MNKYLDLLKLKTNGYLLIDNFWPDNLCFQLRETAWSDEIGGVHENSSSIIRDFDRPHCFTIRDITDNHVVPKVSFLKKDSYIRCWSSTYNYKAEGEEFHTNPDSVYTCIVWVTPTECVQNYSKNNLLLCQKKSRRRKEGHYIIPYRYNRAVIFKSDTVHKMDEIDMISGPKSRNKLISYTFLYNG